MAKKKKEAKIYYTWAIREYSRGDRKGWAETLTPYSKARGIAALKKVEEYLFDYGKL